MPGDYGLGPAFSSLRPRVIAYKQKRVWVDVTPGQVLAPQQSPASMQVHWLQGRVVVALRQPQVPVSESPWRTKLPSARKQSMRPQQSVPSRHSRPFSRQHRPWSVPRGDVVLSVPVGPHTQV